MTWEDCHALINVPEALTSQPALHHISELAAKFAVGLANAASTEPPPAHQQSLSAQLHRLPASMRLELLQGCQLGFPGMLALLSSEEQVTDSEDGLALALLRYLQQGPKCAMEAKILKDQLRYQHMSNAFLGLHVPDIPKLAITHRLLSHLIYLRGLTGGTCIPLRSQQPTVPVAWYAPARKLVAPSPDSVELTLDVSESALSEHLKAAVLFKAGGPAPPSMLGGPVKLRDRTWRIILSSNSVASLLFVGVTCPGKLAGVPECAAAKTAGAYAELVCRMENTSPVISGKSATWFTDQGMGWVNFVQAGVNGKRTGDPMELEWWREYIKEGHVRFTATVKILS